MRVPPRVTSTQISTPLSETAFGMTGRSSDRISRQREGHRHDALKGWQELKALRMAERDHSGRSSWVTSRNT